MTECSVSAVSEPLAATAPVAAAYVVIEQPGPWGRNAVLDSRLPVNVAEHLATAKGSGTTVLLARHADRPERAADGSRNVWLAFTAPGSVRMRHSDRVSDDELMALNFTDLAANALPAIGIRTEASPLFICTHSGRDRCCAIHGRALMGDVLKRYSQRSRVWECSHLGGHRFAPTALSLPTGTTYGRLNLDQTLELLDATESGYIALSHFRGRSAFPAPFQAAEIAVRSHHHITHVDALDVLWVREDRAIPVQAGIALDTIASALAEVRHVDGRAWRVSVRQLPLPDERLESCGGEPIEGSSWVAGTVQDCNRWRD
jgi:hypothetical protein